MTATWHAPPPASQPVGYSTSQLADLPLLRLLFLRIVALLLFDVFREHLLKRNNPTLFAHLTQLKVVAVDRV